MSLSKKRRSGKKNLGMTRNQRRKAEYAAKAGQEWKKKNDSGSKVRLVGARGPHVSCGNPACTKCFIHIPGRGIYKAGDPALQLRHAA